MGLRSSLASFAIKSARGFGQTLGCELVVDISDHSIGTSMEIPNTNSRAWDDNLFKSGQLYLKDHANPIKPYLVRNEDLEDPDEVDVKETKDVDSDNHTRVISSPRYKEYMRQDLISQLLNPRAQWRLIAYAVIILAVLMLANVFISMSAAGML